MLNERSESFFMQCVFALSTCEYRSLEGQRCVVAGGGVWKALVDGESGWRRQKWREKKKLGATDVTIGSLIESYGILCALRSTSDQNRSRRIGGLASLCLVKIDKD